MKNILWVMMAGFLVLTPLAVQADDVDHYAGKDISSKEQAMKTLIDTSAKMADIIGDETLDVTKMEQVHETSYSTEDAVAYLNKETKADLKLLAEKLEEVHLASEGHKANELPRDFVAYQAELIKYLAE